MKLLGRLLALLALASAQPAFAASTTPPNLTPATSVASGDLLLVWPTASVGPLEALSWSNLKVQLTTDLASTWLRPSQNLADLGNATTARSNLGVPLGTSGAVLCSLNSNCTHSGEEITAASTTSGAGFNLPPGTAPTSPSNGDVWVTSSGAFVRVNGSTLTLGMPVYNTTGTLQTSQHIVWGTVTMSGSTQTVTLSGSAVFTSSASYTCTAADQTQVSATRVSYSSGSSFTVSVGTGPNDVVAFHCIGG